MKYYRLSLAFDPRSWDKTFEEEKNNLLFYLKDFKVAIKHIGATAYPGGMSNRNVDILIATVSMQDISSIQVRLQSKGYKVIDATKPEIVLMVGPKKVGNHGVSIRIMEYASDIYSRYNAFEILMKEDHSRITSYNEYRDELNRTYANNFKQYQELKINYINALIDENFRFE